MPADSNVDPTMNSSEGGKYVSAPEANNVQLPRDLSSSFLSSSNLYQMPFLSRMSSSENSSLNFGNLSFNGAMNPQLQTLFRGYSSFLGPNSQSFSSFNGLESAAGINNSFAESQFPPNANINRSHNNSQWMQQYQQSKISPQMKFQPYLPLPDLSKPGLLKSPTSSSPLNSQKNIQQPPAQLQKMPAFSIPSVQLSQFQNNHTLTPSIKHHNSSTNSSTEFNINNNTNNVADNMKRGHNKVVDAKRKRIPAMHVALSPSEMRAANVMHNMRSATDLQSLQIETLVEDEAELNKKRRNRLCEHSGCDKNARGKTRFCVKHGGGSRCSQAGCDKGARPHSTFCSAHGGGHRCLSTGCEKGALAKSVYCRRHGNALREARRNANYQTASHQSSSTSSSVKDDNEQ